MRTESRPVVLIVGAGPGVSGSLARLHASRGYDVGLLGQDENALHSLVDEVVALGARAESRIADITDTDSGRAALSELAAAFGAVQILHFNPSAFREQTPLTLSVPDLLKDVALGVGGLLTAAQAVRPHLGAGSRITATGSMAADRPWSGAASLGVQKAGLRNLVISLDDVLAPDGIRAVSVTVRGTLSPAGPFSPDRVAEAIWNAARQEEAHWRSEITYGG